MSFILKKKIFKMKKNYFISSDYKKIEELIKQHGKIQLDTYYIGNILLHMPTVVMEKIDDNKFILSYEN